MHKPRRQQYFRPLGFSCALLNAFLIVGWFACGERAVADYVGSVAGPTSTVISSAGMEILDQGGGSGAFTYKGGGNAIDAAVATMLVACVVSPQACSLGGYGGHMLIYKAGYDGEPRRITCIDFNSAAGSLAAPDMFVGSVNLTNGHWTGSLPAANQIGWKAVGVPGTFAGLYMAQTNYGRKMDGTNYFPFAEIMKPILSRVASGQVAGNAYYSLASVSNLLMDLYTNSPGYLDGNGNPNPNSSLDPYGVFYSGDIAQDIVAAMQAHGGLVTYPDMTNYRPREVTPYLRHFSCPKGTPATVYVAPPGSAGLSVLQQVAIIEALGWTNGPGGTWDTLHYWHSRAEAARLMWKEHYQWLGDPWSGVTPPDFLGNGSTDFCAQMLAHATNGYPYGCPWDPNEIRQTNSLATIIAQTVDQQTNIPIAIDWDDIRHGTFHISTADRWGNCVSVTFSMGGGFGAQVGVTNRGLVFGQGIALFDARPGWPDSIAPGKRPVDNMCPAIVVPDSAVLATNDTVGGRPPFAVGGGGGSTIENNRAMQLLKYLMDPPSSAVVDPPYWLYNFEANRAIYMRPSYPSGVQSYFTNVGFTTPGPPNSPGDYSYVQAWIAPAIVTPPASTNVSIGSTITFTVQATGLPRFYQWFKDGVPLTDGGSVSGAQSPRVTISGVTNGALYSVAVTNGASSVTSAPAALTVGPPGVVSLWNVGPSNGAAWFNLSGATGVPNQRTIAYNSLSNHLYIVSRSSNTTSNYVIYVLNATNGTLLYTLRTNGIQSNVGKGGIGLVGIGVADDGAIYACNTAPDAAGSAGADPTSLFRVYRWANGDSNTTPVLIFSGDPTASVSPQRWGDSLDVRGAGTNTQILLDMTYFGTTAGTNGLVAILMPADASMTNFVSRWFTTTNFATTVGRSLQFDGTNDAIWQKYPGSALYKTSFHLSAGLGGGRVSSTSVLGATNFPPGLMGVGLDLTRNFAAGAYSNSTSTADTLNLYDVGSLGSPSLLAQYSFPTSPRVANGNRINQTLFRDELLLSLDANNGILVLRLETPPPPVHLTEFQRLPDGAFRLGYSNSVGGPYTIYASTNLVDWNALGTATQAVPGFHEFTDGEATNLQRRFYRLRWP